MNRIAQIATALTAVVGGANPLTGQTQVTVIKSIVALDDNGHSWEFIPDALRPTWKRLPDLPDETVAEFEKDSIVRAN